MLPTPATYIVNSPGSAKAFKIGAGIAVIGLGYFFIARPLIQKWQAQGELNTAQGSTVKPAKGKVMYDISGRKINGANLDTIVVDLYNALHPGWYKPTDQERVVRVFLTIPFGYVQKIEQMYLSKYNENLKNTIADKISDMNFIKIKNWFK